MTFELISKVIIIIFGECILSDSGQCSLLTSLKLGFFGFSTQWHLRESSFSLQKRFRVMDELYIQRLGFRGYAADSTFGCMVFL